MLCCVLLAVGCGGGGGSSTTTTPAGTTSDDTTTAFPATLAVASPLALSEEETSEAESVAGMTAASLSADETESQYDGMVTQLNEILEGTSDEGCLFDPELFYPNVSNAACYGPTVAYENHPDAGPGDPTEGNLPSGDVGIWMEMDPYAEDACAAAQLNARMQGLQERSMGALSGLAAMICTINSSDGELSLPDADNTMVNLTEVMLEPEGVTINTAVLAYGTTTDGEEKYAYTLDFDYNGDHIIVGLVHVLDATSTDVYRGRLFFKISTTVSDGGTNCPMIDGVALVTRNGSLIYNRTSETEMKVEMREAQFCGEDTHGLDEDDLVDPTNKCDETDPTTTGWGDDFNLFRAEFDPTTQLGDYAYAWQAGYRDGNTRVFNIAVTDDRDSTTDDLEAVAFFGYGDDIENLDPSITGFIFNWAGPGSEDHATALKEYAQKQEVSYNATTGHFDSDNASITYAPTNSGTYDGSGSFTYDSTGDGSADTDDATAIAIDLAAGTDDGTGTLTIEKTIADAGITIPTEPSCIDCTDIE